MEFPISCFSPEQLETMTSVDFTIIERELEPPYLEEDIVPSQFYGLNDYLKCRI